MTGRPSGTWTFLFTDIEDSTQRWQDDREAIAAALEVHDVTLTRVVDANGGRVFKHTGAGMADAPMLEAAVHQSRAQLALHDGDPHLVMNHARKLLDLTTGSGF